MKTSRSLLIATPVGPLEITATDEAVTAIRFAGGATDANRTAVPACLPDASTHLVPGDRPGCDAGGNGAGTEGGNKGDIADDNADGNPNSIADGTAAAERAGSMSGTIPAGIPAGKSADPAEALLRQAARELAEYFAGTRREFTFPAAPAGTPFQQAVWAALRTIPCGETRTYGEIAAQIGRPKACRAVGLANNRNPVAIAIPCHRVVGSTGRLTGYAGGLDVKARLLKLEAEPQGAL